MPSIKERREIENKKYRKLYAETDYGMGAKLKAALPGMLGFANKGETYLDVGCGRGESLTIAFNQGFKPVCGIDPCVEKSQITRTISSCHGLAHSIYVVDNSYDVVSCLEVLEHLIPEDTEAAIKEMGRVARTRIILTIASYSHETIVGECHINIKPADEWERLLAKYLPEWEFKRLDVNLKSAAWEGRRV